MKEQKENIELNFGDFAKTRASVLTVRIPSTEVDFHNIKEGEKIQVKLILMREEKQQSLDDGKNSKLIRY